MAKPNEPRYRVGVIGCGNKGTQHARAYQLNPLTEVVAAADPDPGNLELFCERFDVPGYHTYEGMFAKERIDIAAPILPVSANPDAVIAAARAGVKAIFCEKPIAASLEDADRMVEECRSGGIPFACGDAFRSYRQLWKAREIIESGQVGEVQSINLYQSTTEISGGGCQGLSVMRMFARDADVDWVVGWVGDDPFSDDDQAMGGYIRFANGIECFIHFKEVAKRGIEVLCQRGLFFSDFNGFHMLMVPDDADGPGRADPQEMEGEFPDAVGFGAFYDDDGWIYMGDRQIAGVQSIVDSLEKGTEPACPGDSMRKAMEIAIALRESHRRGHAPVKLPLKDRTLKLFPVRGRWLSKKDVPGYDRRATIMQLYKKPPA